MASLAGSRARDRRSPPTGRAHPRRRAGPRRAAPGQALGARAADRRDAHDSDREQAPARAYGARQARRLRATSGPLRPARGRQVRQATRARELYARALELIPGGVDSPVRAMKAVGLEEPLFARRGEGAYLEDADGRRYVDWVLSWGPLPFGHADPETVEAVIAAARGGTSFGAATQREVELAAEIVDAVPSVEQVRLVSSGTEAAMSALRLARAATRRDRILKFAGCYHGHSDALLADAGSGLATLGIPASPGVTTGVARDTVVCAFNDVDGTAAAVARYGEGLAAIVVEPVAGNMG